VENALHGAGSSGGRQVCILVDVHWILWQLPVVCLDNSSLLCYGPVNNLSVIYS
jgi:hypothetical protein